MGNFVATHSSLEVPRWKALTYRFGAKWSCTHGKRCMFFLNPLKIAVLQFLQGSVWHLLSDHTQNQSCLVVFSCPNKTSVITRFFTQIVILQHSASILCRGWGLVTTIYQHCYLLKIKAIFRRRVALQLLVISKSCLLLFLFSSFRSCVSVKSVNCSLYCQNCY